MAILILGSNMLWSLWLALAKLWSLTQQEFQMKIFTYSCDTFCSSANPRDSEWSPSRGDKFPTSHPVLSPVSFRTACGTGSSSCRSLTSLPHYSHEYLCAYKRYTEIPAGNCFPKFHLRLCKTFTQGLMCKCEIICLNIYFFGQPCAVPCHSVKPH